MCHHEHVAGDVPVQDVVERGRDATFERSSAFTSRNNVPIGLFHPSRPCLGKSIGDLVSAQALPIAEKDLAEACLGLWFEPDERSDVPGGLERSLQVARVETGEGSAGQAVAKQLSLAPTQLREGGIGLSLDAMLAVPGRLAVADEVQTPRVRALRRGCGAATFDS